MTVNRFEALEKQTKILQELSDSFPEGSQQYVAIQNAAYALIFAVSEQYDSFKKFIKSSQEELSDEQKDNLRKMGIQI